MDIPEEKFSRRDERKEGISVFTFGAGMDSAGDVFISCCGISLEDTGFGGDVLPEF